MKGEPNMLTDFNYGLDLKGIERQKAVCTVSGGLDSAVAAALAINLGFEPHFIFFDWGQKTLRRESFCARSLATYFNASLLVAEVPLLKNLPGISLSETETQTTAINEYVPNRNAILESQAIAYAEYLRAGLLCIGSTGGDHICPDNSPAFVQAMQHLIDQGTMLKPSIKIIAPLMNTDKTGAVKLGIKLGVPFEFTWSCHNNNDHACGHCSNCEARIEAFKGVGVIDPISYQK
jgi:7-cyano-7-deazaguanine synthase